MAVAFWFSDVWAGVSYSVFMQAFLIVSYFSSLLCRILKQISFDICILDFEIVMYFLMRKRWKGSTCHADHHEVGRCYTQKMNLRNPLHRGKNIQERGWSLIWKPRTDVNSCPKHGHQWPHKRTNVFKNVHLQRTSAVNKRIGIKPNPESVHFLPGCLHYLLLFSKWSVNFSSSWRHHHHHPHREE